MGSQPQKTQGPQFFSDRAFRRVLHADHFPEKCFSIRRIFLHSILEILKNLVITIVKIFMTVVQYFDCKTVKMRAMSERFFIEMISLKSSTRRTGQTVFDHYSIR